MAERIRALELCDDWALGGTALDGYIRVAHLNRELFSPLAVGFSGRGPWLDAAAQGGIATASCAGSYDRLERLIADFAPHTLHTVRNTHLNPFLVTTQRLARKYGVVVEVETNMFGRPGRDAGWMAPTFIRHVSRASMLRYAGLAGVPMSELCRRGDRVIYLPILTQPFAGGGPGPAERERFRRQLGIGPGEVLACRVGRADLRKWSQRLERGIPQVLEAVPNLRYVFQTAPADRIARLRRRLGDRVLCLPLTADMSELARLYHASDLMIHSSGIGESFGCSIAEGMFWRLPVIVDATPHADNAQVELVDHEVTGLVVQAVAGFVEAARRLAADPDARRRLGEAGREKALRLYSEAAVVRLWEKHYIELLDRAGCSAVSDRHRAHAAAITAREQINEADWPAEYQARLGRFSGSLPGWTEKVALRLASARDVVGYARQIGPRRVWGAVRDRLTAGRLFTRA